MAGTLGRALRDELLSFFAPLLQARKSVNGAMLFLRALGYSDAASARPNLQTAIAATCDAVSTLETAPVDDLDGWIGVARLLDDAERFMQACRTTGVNDAAFAELGAELVERLAARHLRLRHPILYRAACILTVVDPLEGTPVVPGQFDGAAMLRMPHRRERLRVDRVRNLLDAPWVSLSATYVPNDMRTAVDAHQGAVQLFARAARLAETLGLFAHQDYFDTTPPPLPDPPLDPDDASGWGEHGDDDPLSPGEEADDPEPPPPDLSAFYRRFQPRLVFALPPTDGSPARTGVSLLASSAEHPGAIQGYVIGPAGAWQTTERRGAWELALSTSGVLGAFVVRQSGVEPLPASEEAVSGAVTLALRPTPGGDGAPAFVFGPAQGTRLELGAVSLRGGLRLGGRRPVVSASVDVASALAVLTPGDGDGFLQRVLSGHEVRIPFALGLDWSSETGLSFRGSTGLRTKLGVRLDLGLVTIDELDLEVVASTAQLIAALTATVGLRLGLVQASLEGVGLSARVSFEDGNLGPIALHSGFSAPRGVGLSIQSESVQGAGFLDRDPSSGRYAGALSLVAQGLALSAAGILEPHVPHGGYSLVGVVSAEFSPIQLGLGFTLNGVGGLIGIHRRVDIEALRTALRGPGVGDIFFAANPVAQAARILGDLGTYFPATQGRHVFGPAVKLGWAGIVEGKLAALLEVPDPVRVTLLGNVHTALPSQDNPLIVINVDVVGEVDFSKKLVAVDASLRDSKVVDLPITGDLAFRMSWGDPPGFVLSIGGFHSQFRPPAGFPKLRRLTIPVGSGDNPRLDAQGFLALTSNTAQVGAQVELFAAAGGLNIRGSVGFEALLEFSPFSFRADLSAGVSLRRHNSVLASVHLDATLTGPTPWRVSGEACLSLWFVDLCVDFDATFGRSHAVQLPRLKPWEALQPELQKEASWTGVLPRGAVRAVTTAPMFGQAAKALIDPHAVLTLRQKVLPLNRKLTRFAQGKPSGADHFNLTEVKLGGAVVPSADLKPVKDWFAPAQFEDLPASERLARDGFEQMDAGVAVASEALKVGASLVCPLVYETVVVRTGASDPKTFFFPALDVQLAGAARSSVARAPLRIASLGPYAPPPGTPPAMAIKEEEHVVVSTADLSRRLDIIGMVSRGEAKFALAAYLELHPGERGSLQVVPSHEAA